MPDPILGEKACVYAVLRPDKKLNLEGLNSFLLEKRKIAKFKLPERLELIDALPLTHVGKVNKKRLREMVASTIEAEKSTR